MAWCLAKLQWACLLVVAATSSLIMCTRATEENKVQQGERDADRSLGSVVPAPCRPVSSVAMPALIHHLRGTLGLTGLWAITAFLNSTARSRWGPGLRREKGAVPGPTHSLMSCVSTLVTLSLQYKPLYEVLNQHPAWNKLETRRPGLADPDAHHSQSQREDSQAHPAQGEPDIAPVMSLPGASCSSPHVLTPHLTPSLLPHLCSRPCAHFA